MQLFTSYFGNSKALAQKGILVIGISRYPPKWFHGISLMELAPQSYMLRLPAKEYDQLFAERILGVLKQHEVVAKIESIAAKLGKSQVALCCYETEQKECHRYNVAVWLKDKGYEIEEFVSEAKLLKVKKQQAQQSKLYLF